MRRTFLPAVYGMGVLLWLVGQNDGWASLKGIPKSVRKARSTAQSLLLRRVMMKTYEEELEKARGSRAIRAKATTEGVKLYEPGFPDDLTLARIVECEDCIFVR